MQSRNLFSTLLLGVAGLSSVAFAQDSTLSLEQALNLAKDRNGDVRAAMFDVEAQRARSQQAWSAFWPTATPGYRWTDTRDDVRTGNVGTFKSSTHTTEVDVRWQLLDSGERSLAFASSRRGVAAQQFTAINTLRGTLFDVYQQYLEALRGQELLRVSDTQVERAKTLLDQTEAQVKVGDAPEKDILQAKADYLNATVQQIQSNNRVVTSQATLKATIGWEADKPLPPLVKLEDPSEFSRPEDLVATIEFGLKNRPDLLAQRKRLESSELEVRRRQLDAGLTWSLDANYNAAFSPNVSQNRTLSLFASVPLFDAGRSQSAIKEAKLSVQSGQSQLVQSERIVRADIESAFVTHSQNIDRVSAAKLALEAAQLNYKAASESQRLGAEGTNVVTVLTAQVSLVTAESNYIEAVYDYYLSEVRLRLASGKAVPGES